MKKIILPIMISFAAGLSGCAASGSANSQARYLESYEKAEPTPMPRWVMNNDIGGSKVCGLGVAGRSYYAESEQTRELSRQRAVENLAGVFGTKIHEAHLSVVTNDVMSSSSEHSTYAEIDEQLIAEVDGRAELDYWYDVLGEGPFNQKGFTYARACVAYKAMAEVVNIDSAKLQNAKGVVASMDPLVVPVWINSYGKQGDRLCAVGYSMPHFQPEETLDGVVSDIRQQLATSLMSMVSSYTESDVSNRSQYIKVIDASINEAVSKGAVVTNYWYDRDGIGTFKQKRTTYGWGCVYPVSVLDKSVAIIKEKEPEVAPTVASVRERAQAAFDALDAEIEAHTDN